MLRFNSPENLKDFCLESNFNTSYVTVQLLELDLNYKQRQNFNTSYVTVQLRDMNQFMEAVSDFNTSYVTVQPLRFI